MIEKSKGGRPQKDAEFMQNKRITVNFTSKEYERATLNAKRLKMPLSALLRKKGLEEVVTEPNLLNEEFLRYLASMASNINQIAHACNSGLVNSNGRLIAEQIEKFTSMLLVIRDEIKPL
jgi:hypothetical protein